MSKEFIEKISNGQPDWIREKRLEAFNQFNNLEMSNFRYGLTIKLDLDDFSFNNVNLNNVFNNNIKLPESPSDKMIIEDLNTAFKKYDLAKEYFMKCFKNLNKFEAFHFAFFNNGIFIHVPKNTEVEVPLQINHLIDKDTIQNLLIVVEPFSKLTILDKITSSSKVFNSKVVEIIVKENSEVNYINLQNLNQDSYNFDVKRAVIEKNAKINWLDCCFGSKLSKVEVSTFLNGEEAGVNNYGLFFGINEQQFDLFSTSIHNAPYTISNMLTKGVLKDKAKNIYRGSIKINENAFQSNGYQKEDTLLLSKDAKSDSIPELYIDNNDVRCTHGATVGHID